MYMLYSIHIRQNIAYVQYVYMLSDKVTTYPPPCKVVLIEYHEFNAQFKHGDIKTIFAPSCILKIIIYKFFQRNEIA